MTQKSNMVLSLSSFESLGTTLKLNGNKKHIHEITQIYQIDDLSGSNIAKKWHVGLIHIFNMFN